jgi:hypothetical protein
MALLAKNKGIIIAWPMPIILSRVLKIDARQILRLAKHIPNKMVMSNIPRIFKGLRRISIRIIRARIKMAAAWKIPRIPAERVLPRTIADREASVEINLFNCPSKSASNICQ